MIADSVYVKKISTFLKEYLPYFFVVLLVLFPVFIKPGYILLTDFVFGPHIPLSLEDGWFLPRVVFRALSWFIPADIVQKIFFTATLGTVLFGGYRLAKSFTNNAYVVFLVALFSLCNPFVYDRIMYGQVGVVIGLGAFLIILSTLVRYYEHLEYKEIVYFGIASGIGILFSAQIVFFIIPVCTIWAVIFLKKWRMQKFWYGIKMLGGGIIIIAVINGTWLFPELYSGKTASFVNQGIQTQDFEAFKTAGDTPGEVITNVALMSGFWGKDQYRYIDITDFPRTWGKSFIFLIPIFVLGFWTMIKDRARRGFLFLLIVLYLVAFLLALGVSVPYVDGITYFLLDNLPMYASMRDTQKWVMVIIAVYGIILAFGLQNIFKHCRDKISAVMATFALSIIVIFQAPTMLFGFWGQLQPVMYPESWYTVQENVICAEGETMLFLPWHLYMYYTWSEQVIASPAELFFDCPIIQSQSVEWGHVGNYQDMQNAEQVVAWIYSRGTLNIQEALIQKGVRYIVLVKEVDWETYDWLHTHKDLMLLYDMPHVRVYRIIAP